MSIEFKKKREEKKRRLSYALFSSLFVLAPLALRFVSFISISAHFPLLYRVSLEPLYNRLVKVIRQSEELTNRLIFYEPVQFPDVIPLFGGIPFGAGFENAPGSEDGKKYKKKQ